MHFLAGPACRRSAQTSRWLGCCETGAVKRFGGKWDESAKESFCELYCESLNLGGRRDVTPPTANVGSLLVSPCGLCVSVCACKSFQVTGKKAEHSEFMISELGSKSKAAILEALFAPRPSGVLNGEASFTFGP